MENVQKLWECWILYLEFEEKSNLMGNVYFKENKDCVFKIKMKLGVRI